MSHYSTGTGVCNGKQAGISTNRSAPGASGGGGVPKSGLEGVGGVEVVDGVAGLGAHPLVVDEGVDDLAEVAGGVDAPGIEDEQGEPAVLFDRDLPQALAESLPRDVAALATHVADRVAQPVVDEPVGGRVVPPVLLGNVLKAALHKFMIYDLRFMIWQASLCHPRAEPALDPIGGGGPLRSR